jgi:hypothetical protein
MLRHGNLERSAAAAPHDRFYVSGESVRAIALAT